MKHEQASRIAGQLIVDLSTYCEYIKVGGSIRRKKPDVKDIELICIPKFGDFPIGQMDLEGNQMTSWENLLFEHIAANDDKYDVIKMGEKYAQIEVFDENSVGTRFYIRVDIFTATPETWGYILLLRTGPWDFSKWAVTELKRKGYTPKDGEIRNLRGTFIPTSTEGEVFNLLGIDYIAPEDRRGR